MVQYLVEQDRKSSPALPFRPTNCLSDLMVNRRTVLLGAFSLFPTTTLAQHEALNPRLEQSSTNDISDDVVPNEHGHADFANAFELEQGDILSLTAQPPDIPEKIVDKLARVRLRTAQEIDQYFVANFRSPFVQWFNAGLAGKSEWEGKRISGPSVQEDFTAYWTQRLTDDDIGLLDFLAYMSVFINECSGNLVSVSEDFGSSGHPGLSYLFDSFPIRSNGRGWRKKSYNAEPLNWSVTRLVTNDLYNAIHGDLALAEKLRGSKDPTWTGDKYPQNLFPTSPAPQVTGYLLEADFFKFRGRGLIQTTWRANYRKLANLIRKYTRDSPVLRRYSQAWREISDDDVCTVTTNADWDLLFSDTSRFLLCEAVKQHARDGGYYPLSRISYELNGAGSGSLQYMGDSIGGSGYGLHLKARVRQICLAMS